MQMRIMSQSNYYFISFYFCFILFIYFKTEKEIKRKTNVIYLEKQCYICRVKIVDLKCVHFMVYKNIYDRYSQK